MFCNLSSQIYKFKKTPIFWLVLICPIAVVGIFISYYSVAPWSIEQKLSGYFQAISLGMICLITLLCTYIAQQEQKAGNCFNILCIGKSRIQTFFALLILLSLFTGIVMVLLSLGFYTFWGNMTGLGYVWTTILMLLPIACLILIQLFVALRFGASWSVALGGVFLLIGALGTTGLLDQAWYYIPPVWAPRFTTLMISNYFHPENIIAVAAEFRQGLLFWLLFTLIFIILVPRWFHKWDGRPSMGEE